MNESHSSTAYRIASIQKVISDKPMTAKEIGVAIGLNLRGAEKYMNHLMDKENKRVHIVEWRQCGPHTRSAVYAWGKGRDKRKPRPKLGIQAAREYRARLRKDEERYEFNLAKERAKDRARRAVRRKRAATWISALGVV